MPKKFRISGKLTLVASQLNLDPVKVYDAVEVFSGKAVLSRCLLEDGFAVGSIDISDWYEYRQRRALEGRGFKCRNPLDLTTSAGFGCLVSRILYTLVMKILG